MGLVCDGMCLLSILIIKRSRFSYARVIARFYLITLSASGLDAMSASSKRFAGAGLVESVKVRKSME